MGRLEGVVLMGEKMAVIIFVAGILSLGGAALTVLVDYWHRKHCLQRMYDMLQSAMDGTFRAETFDESLYAAVENKLAEYLDASEVSTRKTAVERDRIKTLIADISHQTKTPLANILLYTELIKEQEEPAKCKESIGLLESQAKKLNFLIYSLVELSRLETGILVLHPEKSLIAPLLEEASRQYWNRAKEKGLYLDVRYEEAQGIKACYDSKWTLEALGNLLDNAIKYTETGGITVSVKQYELFVCIDVSDTGIGISEEEHAKVFGRFYRSQNVSEKEGVGIGLYLAREILKQQSGYMKLVSTEGEGAVFSMYLPAD